MNTLILTEDLGKRWRRKGCRAPFSAGRRGRNLRFSWPEWRRKNNHHLSGDCGCYAICVLRQRGAGLPVAYGGGDSNADDDKRSGDRWVGRKLPLGRTGIICAGKKLPGPD